MTLALNAAAAGTRFTLLHVLHGRFSDFFRRAKAAPLATLGVPFGILLGWLLIRRAIGHGLPNGIDNAFHLSRSQFGLNELFTAGRTDGWNPTFTLGAQSFLVYGSGVALLFAILKVATFGLVADDTLFNVLTAASFLATVPAVAFLARSLRLDRRDANLLGVLALAISCNFGLGVQGTYYWGLVPHQVALTPLCLALGATLRCWHDPSRRWIVVAACAWAFLAITHLQSATAAVLILLMVLPAMVAAKRLDRAGLKRLAFAAVLAVGLGAFWFAPFLSLNAPRAAIATWPTPSFGDRVAEVLRGDELFRSQSQLVIIAAVGFAFHLVRIAERRRFAMTLAIGPILLWAFTHWVFTQFYAGADADTPIWLRDTAHLLANRTLPYIGILLLVPLACGIGWTTRRFGRAGDALAAGIVVGLVTVSFTNLTWEARLRAPSPNMEAAAVALHELVPPRGRFLFVHVDVGTELALDTGHPGVWLAQRSGRATSNGYGSETVTRFYTNITHEFLGLTPDRAAESLRLQRVTHVVTPTADARTFVDALPGTDQVWQSGSLAIFQVSEPPGLPQPDTMVLADEPIEVAITEHTKESLVFNFSASRPMHIRIGIAAFEKWHLKINGVTRPILLDDAADEGLIGLDVEGSGTVELRYHDDAADVLGRIVSSVTILAVLAWILKSLVARRQRETP